MYKIFYQEVLTYKCKKFYGQSSQAISFELLIHYDDFFNILVPIPIRVYPPVVIGKHYFTPETLICKRFYSSSDPSKMFSVKILKK